MLPPAMVAKIEETVRNIAPLGMGSRRYERVVARRATAWRREYQSGVREIQKKATRRGTILALQVKGT